MNPAIYKLRFDPIGDITPVIQLSQGPMLVVSTPALPARNIKDVIAPAADRRDDRPALAAAARRAGDRGSGERP